MTRPKRNIPDIPSMLALAQLPIQSLQFYNRAMNKATLQGIIDFGNTLRNSYVKKPSYTFDYTVDKEPFGWTINIEFTKGRLSEAQSFIAYLIQHFDNRYDKGDAVITIVPNYDKLYLWDMLRHFLGNNDFEMDKFKRPFGNSDGIGDIAKITGWAGNPDSRNDDGDFTREVQVAAKALYDQFPKFINSIADSL